MEINIEITQFAWQKPVSVRCADLPCSLCGKSIGDKRWVIAMTKRGSKRLCEECAISAEAES